MARGAEGPLAEGFGAEALGAAVHAEVPVAAEGVHARIETTEPIAIQTKAGAASVRAHPTRPGAVPAAGQGGAAEAAEVRAAVLEVVAAPRAVAGAGAAAANCRQSCYAKAQFADDPEPFFP